jgi:cytoskeletal protein CcmA (bactofilin family)
LSGRGEITVAGRLEGDVAVEGLVRVASEGVVVAAVEAEVVDVAGQVKGAVTGTEEVAVRDGGTIDGDVRSPRVAIDDGGRLHGGIQMDFELPLDQAALSAIDEGEA